MSVYLAVQNTLCRQMKKEKILFVILKQWSNIVMPVISSELFCIYNIPINWCWISINLVVCSKSFWLSADYDTVFGMQKLFVAVFVLKRRFIDFFFFSFWMLIVLIDCLWVINIKYKIQQRSHTSMFVLKIQAWFIDNWTQIELYASALAPAD